MSQPTPNPPNATTSSGKRKPRVSLAIATAFGLGYIPKAPGTFGSLAGVVLAVFPLWPKVLGAEMIFFDRQTYWDPFVRLQIALTIGLAFVGVITAHRAAEWWNAKDPQRVVIDEVSGQHLALLLGAFGREDLSLPQISGIYCISVTQ